MNAATRKAHDVVQNPWVNLACTIITIASFAWFLYDKAQDTGADSAWVPTIVFIIVIAVFMGMNCYSFRVRRSLLDFNRVPSHLHRVNHLYRNALSRVCGTLYPELRIDERTLEQEQLRTLTGVCSHIAQTYGLLVGVECQTTIKLLGQDEQGHYCETYARGSESERDDFSLKKYRVGTGENTGFDRALMLSDGTEPSHFWSPDLSKEKDYRNQRQRFEKWYRSTIVVPIRFVIPEKRGRKDCADDIGFLCVDTLSRNRLNNGSHVHLLASFADQMYNFISIMRRTYRLALKPQPQPQPGAQQSDSHDGAGASERGEGERA